MAIGIFAYLHIWVIWAPTKSPKNYRRHHLKKYVPKCSFACLGICFGGKEITALMCHQIAFLFLKMTRSFGAPRLVIQLQLHINQKVLGI